MKKLLIQILSIAFSLGAIVLISDFKSFTELYTGTVIVLGIINVPLMHYFSKRNLADGTILSVTSPSIITSLATFTVGLATFQIIFTAISSINPLWGMNTDNIIFNWPISILAFMIPAQYVGSQLWECTNAKSRKVIWFSSILCGTYLYAGFVLSGLI